MSIKVFYSFKEYQSKYENLLEDFLIDYIDNTEEDFISEQLELYSICLDNVVFTEVWKDNDDFTWSEFYIKAEAETQNVIKEIARKILILEREENSLYNNYDPNVNIELCKQYERSFSKIISYIEKKLFEIEKPKMENFTKSLSQKSMNEIKTLNWQGTELEFTELIKSLILSKKLNPELTQKETFKRMKLFFNVVEFKENDKLKDIRKRSNTLTPFINILETSLNNWIKSKD